ILIGDTFDNFGLSTWPKDTKKLVRYRIVDEIASAEPVIKKLDRTFRRVYYIPGNHEARWENVLRKTPALDGLEWWWPLRGVLPSHWELLPINVQLRFKAADGRWVHIEHG